jgi:DNA-binding winged helix-turn-helix (wHTH) protein
MMLCPYCKQPIDSEVANLPRMSERRLRIFKTLLEAGPEGITRDDLLVRMYDEDEWPTPGGTTVLRVNIHEINRLIAPQNLYIEGRRMGGYRLVHLEDGDEEKESEGEDVHPASYGDKTA